MAQEQAEKDIGITVKKEDNMPEWYQQVILKAELADFAPVKGFMVIRPNGYAIWQRIMDYFNVVLKEKKVRNAYFPLLIPESFFKKEAQHAKGFEPELAWITRDSEEAERLAIRPTSETIMYDAYARWIRSWRDLPLRINQWCNVLRWEVSDVKLFMRSREFLWQEGHCVYENEKECEREALMYLDEYRRLAEDLLAIPVIPGEKTEKERFPGAKKTFTVETFMPEGKALQMGTSHNLGQGFANSFGISFLDKNEEKETPWQNSWGFSTRLIGATVMMHSDNKGLVLPPRAAEHKIVIVPILFKGKEGPVLEKAKELQRDLKAFSPILDDRNEYTPGWKFNEWEMKGIPLRLEIGPRDIENNEVIIVRRDDSSKYPVKMRELEKRVPLILTDMQLSLFSRAKEFLRHSTIEAKSWQEFEKAIEDKKLVKAPFCLKVECEMQIKEKTQASSRCIPFNEKDVSAVCVHCGHAATKMVYFGRSY